MDRELLLLGLLRQQEMHGYQLYEFIDRDLATCTDLKKPTAYYLLNKMAEDGWITEEQAQEGNRPMRRVYRLTAQGEIEYQRLLRKNLASYTSTIFPGDAGLAFMDSLEPQEALTYLNQRRVALVNALEVARSAPAHEGSKQLVVEHQVYHLGAELDWLDKVIAQLERKAG